MILRCIESFGALRRQALESYGIKILRDLTMGDRRLLYQAIEAQTPGVNFRRSIRCAHCNGQFSAVLEASGFFRVGLGGGARIAREVFYLAYHLHWSRTEIADLDVSERRAFVRMLAERIESENEMIDELNRRLQRR